MSFIEFDRVGLSAHEAARFPASIDALMIREARDLQVVLPRRRGTAETPSVDQLLHEGIAIHRVSRQDAQLEPERIVFKMPAIAGEVPQSDVEEPHLDGEANHRPISPELWLDGSDPGHIPPPSTRSC
ncbi:hypothetical protein [Leucobacter musarum]|uniref:hypothetical protein n=1 Tax=Leucobacter musarum TaxID=1930747 RepID=UPI0012E30A1B|nr:hypothetical protein [Leucobacter musarum]